LWSYEQIYPWKCGKKSPYVSIEKCPKNGTIERMLSYNLTLQNHFKLLIKEEEDIISSNILQ